MFIILKILKFFVICIDFQSLIYVKDVNALCILIIETNHRMLVQCRQVMPPLANTRRACLTKLIGNCNFYLLYKCLEKIDENFVSNYKKRTIV